jgi:multidrug efflux pump subunit AcrA (membrane-fusion protein)
VDAFPDKTFTGKVTDIDTTGTVSSGVVTYPVTITCDTEVNQLYANMTVTANIITFTKDNVLLIPVSAVQKGTESATVRVLKDGKLESVTVEIGDSSDSQIEITAGLTEGEQLVTGTTPTTTTRTTGTTSIFGNSGFGGAGRNVRIQTR